MGILECEDAYSVSALASETDASQLSIVGEDYSKFRDLVRKRGVNLWEGWKTCGIFPILGADLRAPFQSVARISADRF